jgi:glycerol kinase
MWKSPDELAALWEAEARFEPELPVELTDAVYVGWQRAVDRSRDWAR